MKKKLLFLLMVFFYHDVFAALTIDGSVNSNTITGSTVHGVLTTSNTNDIILAFFKTSTNNVITGVSDVSGLTWNFRSAYTANNDTRVELWYATSSGILTGDIITGTFTSAPSSPRIFAVGINGGDLTYVFDPNTSLPTGLGANSVTSLTRNISTSNTNTMIVSLFNGNSCASVTPFSGSSNIYNAAGFYSLDYHIVASKQISAAITYGTGSACDAAYLVDAICASGCQPNPITSNLFFMGIP